MKRTNIKRRPLADTVLASLEPETSEYREKYGIDRIYFVVNPSGKKRWELRYKKPATGRWSWTGLGSYPDVSAKAARAKANEIMQAICQGTDPTTLKTQNPNSKDVLFSKAAAEWFAKKERDGRAEKTLKSIRYALDNDILPALGNYPVNQITRQQCADLQKNIEERGALNTSEKVRSWLNQIFGMAIAKGWGENNPASNLKDIAERTPSETQYPHLLENELPDFLRALRKTPSKILAQTAAWMAIRTASRPGMVRMAEWCEIDLEQALWEVPAHKMKMRNAHTIPLPTQMVSDLRELDKVTGRSKYLFPGEGSKTPYISDGTINKLFRSAGYKGRMTGHGSRHTCTTLLSEHGWPDKWSDAQLAHKKGGMRQVYDKAAYLKQRTQMIQWYSDYLDALERGMTKKDQAALGARVPVRIGPEEN